MSYYQKAFPFVYLSVLSTLKLIAKFPKFIVTKTLFVLSFNFNSNVTITVSKNLTVV